MTRRGWIITTLRAGLLVFGVMALGALALDRFQQPSQGATGPSTLGPDSKSAPTTDWITLEGPVEIVGPDGSVLSSQTGAEFDPDTGNLDLRGQSSLSSTR